MATLVRFDSASPSAADIAVPATLARCGLVAPDVLTRSGLMERGDVDRSAGDEAPRVRASITFRMPNICERRGESLSRAPPCHLDGDMERISTGGTRGGGAGCGNSAEVGDVGGADPLCEERGMTSGGGAGSGARLRCGESVLRGDIWVPGGTRTGELLANR